MQASETGLKQKRVAASHLYAAPSMLLPTYKCMSIAAAIVASSGGFIERSKRQRASWQEKRLHYQDEGERLSTSSLTRHSRSIALTALHTEHCTLNTTVWSGGLLQCTAVLNVLACTRNPANSSICIAVNVRIANETRCVFASSVVHYITYMF